MSIDHWRRLLPGLWAGWMLCVGLLATPSAFALLERGLAGRVAARVLAAEAYLSLALGVLLLLLERAAARRALAAGGSQFSGGMVLALLALFCTVAGYFGVLPMMEAAHAGRGTLGFGALHALSSSLYVVKVLAVLALAWIAARGAAASARATPSAS